jgi:THO complex subunit 2
LSQLLSNLVASQENLLSYDLVMTHLDDAFIISVGVLDQRTYGNKRSKAITQFIYEQQKFNLLREENEGFAKLIVELNQPNITMENIEVVKKNVEALIGFFNLDPNRVLDIILESFASGNIWNQEPYLTLLSDYKGKYVAQVLGFKFQHHLDRLQTALKVPKSPTSPTLDHLESLIPKRLCLVCAILVARKVIKLEDIWSHLSNFQETKDDADEIESLLKRQIKLV